MVENAMVMKRAHVCHGLIVAAMLAASLAGPVRADPNCKCRFYGHRYELGTVMCVMGRLSRCVMVLNNTSWKPIARGCPQASLSLPRDRDASMARLAALSAGAVPAQ